MRLTRVLIIPLVVFLMAWPAPAVAAVPTADELLTDITAKRIHVGSLEVVFDFQPAGIKTDDDTAETVSSETLFFRQPDRIRISLALADVRQTFMAVGVKTFSLMGDQAGRSSWPQPFLLFRLLIDSDATSLKELLSAFSFDLTRVSLGRHRGGIVYILGARAGDFDLPQAWIDRKTLRIVRLILPPGRKSPGYDLEMTEYSLHQQRVDWPGVITASLDKKPDSVALLKSLIINPQSRAAIEDGEKEKTPKIEETDFEELLAKDPDIIKIRKMMEWFDKKLE